MSTGRLWGLGVGPGDPELVTLKAYRLLRAADTVAWFTGREAVPGSADLCFITTASPADVKAHWVAEGVEIEAGPVERDGARGKMTSVYCRDPDGNLIEVATYPGE